MEEEIIAANGVPVYYYRLPNIHSCSICLYVKTGCLYETENSGITHFLEHLHFRRLGGKTQKEFYFDIESKGAAFNATTYKEFLQFRFSVNPKHFDEIAKLACCLLEPLNLTEADFSDEKRTVLNEIRESNLMNDVDTISNQYIWKGTPLENPVLGSITSVQKIKRKTAMEEKQRVFSLGNFFFYVTGCFDRNNIQHMIREIENYSLPKADFHHTNIAPIPAGFQKRDAFAKILTRTYSMLDVKVSFDVDFSSIHRQELLFMDSILSDGLCSLIREDLIETKGLIYDFSSTVEEYANIGTYSFTFEIQKSCLYELLERFVAVLKKVKKGFTDRSLQTATVFYTDNKVNLLDSDEDLNWNFSYDNHILSCRYRTPEELAELYRAITKERLTELANTIFQPDNAVVVCLGKKDGLSEKKLHRILSDV